MRQVASGRTASGADTLRWRPAAAALAAGSVPPDLRGWLAERGSLTARLAAACPRRLALVVLAEGWARPAPDEAARLGLRRGAHAWVRHVHLLCGRTPWLFARTVVPVATLRGPGRRLQGLGTRPLGELLHRVPGVGRSALEVACLRPGHPLHRLAWPRGARAAIWGRRSVYTMGGRPLLVSEFFLPPLAGGT